MVKKLIYFLGGLHEASALQFLRENPKFLSLSDRKPLPKSFIISSQKFFGKSCSQGRNLENWKNLENPLYLPWRVFCAFASYEEALVVFLLSRYPIHQVSWLLNTPPESLNYRLSQGLKILGESLPTPLTPPLERAKSLYPSLGFEQQWGLNKKARRAWSYSLWLNEKPLPEGLKSLGLKKFYSVPKKILFLGFIFGAGGAFLGLIFWGLIRFFEKDFIILYP